MLVTSYLKIALASRPQISQRLSTQMFLRMNLEQLDLARLDLVPPS